MRILRRWRTGPPTCDEIAGVLQAYLDGECDSQVAARVALHLGECDNCSFEAETLENIKKALSRLRRETDSEAVRRLTVYIHALMEGQIQ